MEENERMKRVKNYFNDVILPMIQSKYPKIYDEMSIMILGSVGLGIDDSYSDLEAAVYLEDELWNRYGRELQLSLEQLLHNTNPWKSKGSILCVHPVSWLLDGNAKAILDNKKEIPWEEISMETLFTIQNNLIVIDQKEILRRLRESTLEQVFPKQLWKKQLILQIKQFMIEDYFELIKCIRRNHLAEATIVFGQVVQDIYQLAFLVSKHYYPWRTHLNWAFEKLSISETELRTYITSLTLTQDWSERVNRIDKTIDFFKDYISRTDLLPELDLDTKDLEKECVWAERLAAWNHPDWKDYIREKEATAISNGYTADDFWIWSLWG